MQKGVGFVRIKPIQCEKGAESRADDDDQLFDPFVTVKVLDAENVPGQKIVSCLLDLLTLSQLDVHRQLSSKDWHGHGILFHVRLLPFHPVPFPYYSHVLFPRCFSRFLLF